MSEGVRKYLWRKIADIAVLGWWVGRDCYILYKVIRENLRSEV